MACQYGDKTSALKTFLLTTPCPLNKNRRKSTALTKQKSDCKMPCKHTQHTIASERFINLICLWQYFYACLETRLGCMSLFRTCLLILFYIPLLRIYWYYKAVGMLTHLCRVDSSTSSIGQVRFQKKGCLVFYYYLFLQKFLYLLQIMWTLIRRHVLWRLMISGVIYLLIYFCIQRNTAGNQNPQVTGYSFYMHKHLIIFSTFRNEYTYFYTNPD